jgi:hypothetical protein
MTNQHPITPPPELVDKWYNEWLNADERLHLDQTIAVQAARWGADQELEACAEWVHEKFKRTLFRVSDDLRAARRPKPPTLKEQAHSELDAAYDKGNIDDTTYKIIRHALEALPNG